MKQRRSDRSVFCQISEIFNNTFLNGTPPMVPCLLKTFCRMTVPTVEFKQNVEIDGILTA